MSASALVDTLLSHSTLTKVVLAVLTLLLAVVIELARRRATYAHLPPGPLPHLLTGNDYPATYPWRAFYELSKTYGPVITLWTGTQPSVILNDMASATWFLDKHSRDTSDRPPHWAYISGGKRVILQPHGERWRRMRRALYSILQPAQATQLRGYQERVARGVVLDILGGGEFQDHIRTYAATISVHMAYGRMERARYSDPDIAKIVENSARFGNFLRPGGSKLDAFPWLAYVPGYMRQMNRWNAEELVLFRSALDDVKARSVTGPERCFATYLLERKKELELSYDEVAYLCGSVFGAGSDATSAAIQIIVMAAATHPEWQARVQAELDQATAGQPPGFDDLAVDAVPHLHAFVAESYRWRPVSAGGFIHRTTAPVMYGDYVVPAGVLISGNHWAIHRDTSYFGADVETFNPSRWIKDGKFNEAMKHVQFGFGRRVCPGHHVAHNSVLINAALLLWAFNMTEQTNSKGKLIPIDTLAFTNTANSHPLKFNVSFHERVANLAELMSVDNI
ncbi:cytochrome P450 [Cutaneotrichosporon oleaginosum]|uniref:Cytochrome P450 n=1 Tax=Cutaneotrichosporon oleaginosum TaxID=879819 RepID=A0A0J0XZU7_9TREE|nr:cytochrome P450 [Cutaneotrichosporon oleaginosum]KLT46546.1 cytochrome P450 [Cutaneotrichosporon oleaginosum]TXT15087.1 hypothetical protein COLE_01280 [Cutaneotrichosporon oleaginosum]